MSDLLAVYAPDSSLTRAALGTKAKPAESKVDKSAKDFEAVFLSQMLDIMFQDVDIGGFGEAEGEEVYKSWMVQEYARLMTDAGGIGIASHVKTELLKLQEMKGSGV